MLKSVELMERSGMFRSTHALTLWIVENSNFDVNTSAVWDPAPYESKLVPKGA